MPSRRDLLIGFLSVAVIAVVAAATGVWHATIQKQAYDRLADDGLLRYHAAIELMTAATQTTTDVRHMNAATTQSPIDRTVLAERQAALNDTIATVTAKEAAYRALVDGNGVGDGRLQRMDDGRGIIARAADALIGAVTRSETSVAIVTDAATLLSSADDIAVPASQIVQDEAGLISQARQEQGRASLSAWIGNLTLALIATVLAALMALRFSKRIAVGLQDVEALLRPLSAGGAATPPALASIGSNKATGQPDDPSVTIATLTALAKALGARIATTEQALTERDVLLTKAHTPDAAEEARLLGEKRDDEARIAELERTKRATLNLLEDIDREKKNARDAQARTEAVIASISDGVAVVDRQGKMITCNPAAQALLQIPGKGWVGKQWEDLHSFSDLNSVPIPPAEHPMTKVFTLHQPINKSYFLNRKTDQVPIALTASPVLLDNEPTGAVLVFRDITVDYQLDRAKSEFVSIASHQLRTPLTAINWYAESLSDGDYGKLAPEQQEPAESIRESSHRMSKLINALLNVSRIETGRLKISPVPTPLTDIVNDVLEETRQMIDTKKLRVAVNAEPGLSAIVADRSLTKIVLQNLIHNAIKYTPDGGQVTVSMTSTDGDIMTTVQDTGLGIPADQQNKIFQKMYRAENVQRSGIEGTGLGLYIAKAIVEQSGGKIWFTSKENEGTTFHFTLPIKGVPAKAGTHTLIEQT